MKVGDGESETRILASPRALRMAPYSIPAKFDHLVDPQAETPHSTGSGLAQTELGSAYDELATTKSVA
jgi:hypothetical protein